jgi:hypothetical protein
VISCRPRFDVVVNPELAQFGAIPRGQTPTQTVKVEYAGPLEFKVKYEPPKELQLPVDVAVEPLYRQPGRVGYAVKLTVRSDAPPNAYKQELYLSTNDPSTPVLPVSFDVTVRPTLAVTAPPRDDSLKVGVAVTKRVLVRSGDNKPFKITGVDNQGDGVSVELSPMDGPVQVLVVKIQPVQAGWLSRKLVVRTDLGPDAVATVPIEGTVNP